MDDMKEVSGRKERISPIQSWQFSLSKPPSREHLTLSIHKQQGLLLHSEVLVSLKVLTLVQRAQVPAGRITLHPGKRGSMVPSLMILTLGLVIL